MCHQHIIQHQQIALPPGKCERLLPISLAYLVQHFWFDWRAVSVISVLRNIVLKLLNQKLAYVRLHCRNVKRSRLIEPDHLAGSRVTRYGRSNLSSSETISASPFILNIVICTVLSHFRLIGAAKDLLPPRPDAAPEVPCIHDAFLSKQISSFWADALINLPGVGQRRLASTRCRDDAMKEDFHRPGLSVRALVVQLDRLIGRVLGRGIDLVAYDAARRYPILVAERLGSNRPDKKLESGGGIDFEPPKEHRAMFQQLCVDRRSVRGCPGNEVHAVGDWRNDRGQVPARSQGFRSDRARVRHADSSSPDRVRALDRIRSKCLHNSTS